MNWQQQTAAICHAINALTAAIGREHRNSGGVRASEYLAEAKTLIEIAFDVLRREERWSKHTPILYLSERIH